MNGVGWVVVCCQCEQERSVSSCSDTIHEQRQVSSADAGRGSWMAQDVEKAEELCVPGGKVYYTELFGAEE